MLRVIGLNKRILDSIFKIKKIFKGMLRLRKSGIFFLIVSEDETREFNSSQNYD